MGKMAGELARAWRVNKVMKKVIRGNKQFTKNDIKKADFQLQMRASHNLPARVTSPPGIRFNYVVTKYFWLVLISLMQSSVSLKISRRFFHASANLDENFSKLTRVWRVNHKRAKKNRRNESNGSQGG